MKNSMKLITIIYLLTLLAFTQAAIEGCASVDSSGRCQVCNNGLYLTSANKCVVLSPIQNCTLYQTTSSGNTFCVTCASGFVLLGDILCASAVPNCLNYDLSSLKCYQCAKNYVLTPQKNCETIANCLAYDFSTGSTRCKTCGDSFQLTNDSLLCLPAINFCTAYGSSSKASQFLTCNACIGNYKATDDKRQCLVPVILCATHYASDINSPYFTCAQCNNGYITTSDQRRCLKAVVNCNQYVLSNYYTSQLKCTGCFDGFAVSVDQNNCVKGIQNCSSNSIDSKTNLVSCKTCLSGFVSTSNNLACIPAISHCLNYKGPITTNVSLICTQCEANYNLGGDSTSCSAQIANCQTYATSTSSGSSSPKCSLCNNGYQLSANNTQCLSSAANCLSYNADKTQCLSCPIGFRLTDDSLACLPIIKRCTTYSYSTASSLKLTCLTCNRGLIPTDDGLKCLVSISNCSNYYISDLNTPILACQTCDSYYRKTDDELACLPDIDGCTTFAESYIKSETLNCLACKTYYTLSSDATTCTPLIANCDVYIPNPYDPTSLVCQTCSGCYLTSKDQKKCLPPINNCLAYIDPAVEDNYSICDGCPAGQTLYEQIYCLPTIDNCPALPAKSPTVAVNALDKYLDKPIYIRRIEDGSYISAFQAFDGYFYAGFIKCLFGKRSEWIISRVEGESQDSANYVIRSVYYPTLFIVFDMLRIESRLLATSTFNQNLWNVEPYGDSSFVFQNYNGLYLQEATNFINCAKLFEIIIPSWI